jgi:hypothetical protein
MRQIMKAGVRPPDPRTKEFEAILGKEGSTYWRLPATGSFEMKAWWGSYAASARDRLWHMAGIFGTAATATAIWWYNRPATERC